MEVGGCEVVVVLCKVDGFGLVGVFGKEFFTFLKEWKGEGMVFFLGIKVAEVVVKKGFVGFVVVFLFPEGEEGAVALDGLVVFFL